MEWVISSNNNASKKHDITNLRKQIHNTLHNLKGIGFFQSCLIPEVELPNVFIFGGPFQI
jgi:hypothetical protein